MSKEMMIVFLYDTECCKKEEDDPASAILYFHPSWVSDQQRTNLCGQIIGTTHFLKSTFGSPNILALQSGKFFIHDFGRYILAVGTDRNIDDWILQHRANTIKSLISFFHCDLYNISQQCQSYVNFTEKLYTMFETYLKILQYSGNIFCHVPLLQLPKSANSVYLEAIQIMQHCQEIKYVLGGTMLYHNKVVATQLSPGLTKRLVITDPYRIKCPGEAVDTDFSLPLGVQLFYVYINNQEYKHLQSDSISLQQLNINYFGKSQKKMWPPKLPKEPVLSAMKRDQSLIFTTVPEEDDHISPMSTETITKPINKTPDRPKSLSLKFTTSDTNIKQQPQEKSITTPFNVQTSVCSTPLTDKFLHGNPLSICCNTDIEMTDFKKSKKDIENSGSVNSVLSDMKSEKTEFQDTSDKLANVSIRSMYAPNLSIKRSSSIEYKRTDIANISMRYYGIGLSNLDDSIKSDRNEPHLYNTITDPMYPVFRSDGVVISKPLYDHYFNEHCEFLNTELRKELDVEKSVTEDWKSIDDFDSDMKESPKKSIESNIPPKVNQEARRSLSLPLKSLSFEQSDNNFPSRRNLGGVQLTPLMSKLSLLAMEEKSSGFCSRDTTPSEFRDFGMTPTDNKNYSLLNRKNSIAEKEDDFSEDEEVHKVVLFICGQQDMVLNLILDENAADEFELINNLWEICIETLGKLEMQLRHCLDPYPVAPSDQGETYSYLCLDSQWNTIQRGGPWGVTELGALTHLHREFNCSKNLTEITLRNEDSIIYGYRCGETEVYYQQSATSNSGLPPPADPMGVVPLKARRKLERDHAIILL